MRAAEIESWVLGLIERTRRKEPVEDQRVELKREFPEPSKAARRIAAHVNSARAESIVWVIGIDEGGGLVGARNEEIANWWPRVQSQFDQLAPDLLLHLNVPVDDKTVVALLINAERRPLVVKNPKPGDAITFEVPWREGTLTRTARRSELITILAPTLRLPRFEITNCRVTTSTLVMAGTINQPKQSVATQIQATFRLYIIPTERTVLRKRLSTATITSSGTDSRLAFLASVVEEPPHPVFASGPDIVADGPGAFSLVFQGEEPGKIDLTDEIKASMIVHIVDAPLIILGAELRRDPENQRWGYGRDI